MQDSTVKMKEFISHATSHTIPKKSKQRHKDTNACSKNLVF